MAQTKSSHRKLAASVTWCAAVAISASLGVSSARAGDRRWNVATGFWSTSANWNPGAVPGPADTATIDYFAGGSAGVARINTTAIGAVTAVTVLNGGTVTISNQGSLLCGTDFVLGTGSTQGTLNVLTTNPALAFPGGLTVVTDLRLGVSSGVGLVNQDAGTVTIGRSLIIGDSSTVGSLFTGVGTYNLTGTGVLKAPTIKVATAFSTTGTLSVSAFAKLSTDSLTIGSGGPGQSGYVRQTGGQVTVAGYTTLQSSQFGTGSSTYNLSGGTLITGGFQINDRCVFNFTGGSASVGTLRMANGHAFMSSGGNKVLRAYDLAFFYDSGLDVNDNAMIMEDFFQYESGLRAVIKVGYNGGAWNGNCISSTAARINPLHNTALGYAAVWDIMEPIPGGYVFEGQHVNGYDVVVKYTYYGDTDLNGAVNFDDYSRIDSGFNNNRTGWVNGDFDYNGVVNFDDYALIDLAFNTQSGALRGGLNAVPEPSSLAAAVVLGTLALRTSRRR